MVRGLPGDVPGPSLGEPRVEGPTVRHRDEPVPEGREETVEREAPQWGSADPPAHLRYRDNSDVPVLDRARPSGRPGSANGGDRDHRGWPLLLGVGMKYQISYRNNPPQTSPFPKIAQGTSGTVVIRSDQTSTDPQPSKGRRSWRIDQV